MDLQNPYAAPMVDVNVNVVPSEQALATAGSRFAARFIDGLLSMVPVMLAVVTAGVASAALKSEEGPPAVALVLMAVGMLGAVALWLFQVIRLVQTGQTLGKKWMGVRVVSLDGSRISVWTHLLRGLVLGVAGAISAVFIFRQDRRCLHDLAADTRVVVA